MDPGLVMMREKGVQETIFWDYKQQHNLDIKVVKFLILLDHECKKMMEE